MFDLDGIRDMKPTRWSWMGAGQVVFSRRARVFKIDAAPDFPKNRKQVSSIIPHLLTVALGKNVSFKFVLARISAKRNLCSYGGRQKDESTGGFCDNRRLLTVRGRGG